MSTTASRRSVRSTVALPPIRDVHMPPWLARRPQWLVGGVVLLGLLVLSAVLRSRQLGGELWFNEAIATGIASHSFGELPGVLRDGGSAPLYYVLLHLWTSALGDSESETRALSLLFALLTIPVAGWAGWSLGGRRAGLYAAVLLAFSAFLTQYAEETQPYALMALLGLLVVTGFLHGFVYRRRRYLWLFAIALEAALYTHGSAGLLVFGLVVALVPIVRCAPPDRRRAILLDAALCFGVVALLYVPWLPTTIHQIAHATSPWHYAPLLGFVVPGDMVGGERVVATLAVVAVVGLAPLLVRARRRTPEAVTMWALVVLAFAALGLAAATSVAAPDWVARYSAPLVGSVLLLGAVAAARSKVVGAVAILLVVVFSANPSSFASAHKSDMRDIAGQLGPRLHAGDVVASGQPEQTPLAWYDLPAGLRYWSTIGPIRDPTYMNWSDAQRRLTRAPPAATAGALVASLRRGQQLLFVRPLTEGSRNWNQPWTRLVRRRSAQWGQILINDVANGTLTAVARAPSAYPGACCVADSAILYRKAS